MSVDNKKLLQGAAIGAMCGLLASAAMNVVPAIWSRFDKPKPQEGDGDDATVKTAEKIAEPVLDRPLTDEEKKTGAPAVHFAFGTTVGALYGALAVAAPPVTVGLGTAYASAVWLLGDEIAVPSLGLAPPPRDMPASGHFKYWLSHVVYGITLDTARRIVYKRLG